MTDNRLPWDIPATDADDEKAAAAAAQVARRLIIVLLLTVAALDLTRCGLVLTAARHPAPTAGLVAAGLAATGLTARTARACQVGQRWAGWAALLIGAASAPQAVASGFRSPYTIPDTATAAVGLLLAITILATAGRTGRRDTTPKFPACRTGKLPGVPPGSTPSAPGPRQTLHDPAAGLHVGGSARRGPATLRTCCGPSMWRFRPVRRAAKPASPAARWSN